MPMQHPIITTSRFCTEEVVKPSLPIIQEEFREIFNLHGFTYHGWAFLWTFCRYALSLSQLGRLSF